MWLKKDRIASGLGFRKVDTLALSHALVVFQGVEGAYSQQAMLAYFGEDCKGYHVETWRDAMNEIRDGKADYAVLPIENSSAGSVSENYDLLAEYENYIVAQQTIPIDHALLGLPDAGLSDIRKIYSHPQALMQCAGYLDERRDWERISTRNTAVAAVKVRDSGDKTRAAIASELSAQLYGLKLLDTRIQDRKNNFTKFIIVHKEAVCRRDADHISICFELANRSGSLYRSLGHFMENNLNMTYIQSRPKGDRNWEYRFFVEFEGRTDDERVLRAMDGLLRETEALKILGTY